MIRNFTIHHGHVLDVLRGMESESVHCVVSSPPYFGLRDYGVEPAIWDGNPNCDHVWLDATYVRNTDKTAGAKQNTNSGAVGRDEPVVNGFCSLCGAWRGCFGLEPSLELYVAHSVQILREIRRILRPDGTVWWNVGDSYAGSWGNYGGQNRGNGTQREIISGSLPNPAYDGLEQWKPPTADVAGLKPKDLCMIPARVALALQADGWWLRSEIIWAKPAPMPESVTDRPTRSHEQIFLLTKSEKYFYDQNAVRQPLKQSSIDRLSQDVENQNGSTRANGGAKSNGNFRAAVSGGHLKSQIVGQHSGLTLGHHHQDIEQGANLRDVWTINTEGFRDAHFAVFPTEIPRRCILAGTSEKGVCGECGAPWTRVVERSAMEINRSGRGEKIFGGNHSTAASGTMTKPPECLTIGWQPSCKHEGDPIPATVLDPFAGSGTTLLVALRYGRSAIGIELNPDYVRMAEKRIRGEFSLFADAWQKRPQSSVSVQSQIDVQEDVVHDSADQDSLESRLAYPDLCDAQGSLLELAHE